MPRIPGVDQAGGKLLAISDTEREERIEGLLVELPPGRFGKHEGVDDFVEGIEAIEVIFSRIESVVISRSQLTQQKFGKPFGSTARHHEKSAVAVLTVELEQDLAAPVCQGDSPLDLEIISKSVLERSVHSELSERGSQLRSQGLLLLLFGIRRLNRLLLGGLRHVSWRVSFARTVGATPAANKEPRQ